MAALKNLVLISGTRLSGILLALLVTTSAHAGSNNAVDGDTGVLYVHGVLQHSACNLDSDSIQQSVNLGTVNSEQLRYPGERAAAKAFNLHLRDCFDYEMSSMHTRTGNEEITDGLPFVKINFMGMEDTDNKDLIALHGARGFGLRLEDQWHRAVHLNDDGEPLRVAVGSPELTYYLLPERTHTPLKEGEWQAVIYIGLTYD